MDSHVHGFFLCLSFAPMQLGVRVCSVCTVVCSVQAWRVSLVALDAQDTIQACTLHAHTSCVLHLMSHDCMQPGHWAAELLACAACSPCLARSLHMHASCMCARICSSFQPRSTRFPTCRCPVMLQQGLHVSQLSTASFCWHVSPHTVISS